MSVTASTKPISASNAAHPNAVANLAVRLASAGGRDPLRTNQRRARTTFRITDLVLPRAPSGRKPAAANSDSVPAQRNELE
jgi:hypothetical protein